MHAAKFAQDGCLVYLRIADPPPPANFAGGGGGGSTIRTYSHKP